MEGVGRGQFAYRHTNRQDGKESSVVTFSEVQVNPEVDPIRPAFERARVAGSRL
jgi:hypothetical protein